MKKIQLSIPEPCHESWDAMTPTQQGRFCNACAKEVVDFSSMSDHEVLNYFNRHQSASVCGRAWSDQLDRVIAMDPGKKRSGWLQYAAAMLLLFKSGDTKAQGEIKMPRQTDTTLAVVPKKSEAPSTVVNGTVLDETGFPIPFAQVRWLNTDDRTSADANGKFSLKFQPQGAKLQVAAYSYITSTYDVNQAGEQIIHLKVDTAINVRLVAVGGISVKRVSKKSKKIPLLSRLFSSFTPVVKAYPNPVTKGGTLSITAALKNPGLYTVQLADANGQILLSQQVNSIDKKLQHQITTNSSWSAGMYFVKIMDVQGKLVGTEKLMVQ